MKLRTIFPLRETFYTACALVLLTLLSIFFFDREVAYSFEHTSGVVLVLSHIVNAIAHPFPNVLLWPIIYYFVHFIYKKEELGKKILVIAIAVNLSNLICVILKALFARDRPEVLFASQSFGFHFFDLQTKEHAFPSGHATTIAAVLFSIACFYPKRFLALLAGAFILSLGRVVVGAHFLADIFGGLFVGLLVSQEVYATTYQKRGLARLYFWR